jgi:D-3-phosphoglycerate dehydrogenase
VRKRVLVTESIHPAGLRRLAEEVEVVTPEGASLEALVGDVSALVVRIAKIGAGLLDKAPRLAVIGKHGIGVDNIDVQAATSRGIPIIFTPGTNDQAVAEHSLTMLLMLAKRVQETSRAVREGRFATIRGEPTGYDVRGKTLGLIGVGRIGSKLAAMCKLAFDMRVLAYDPYVTPERAAALGVEKVDSLAPLLAAADFISIHTPLTPETRRLIGARELAQMKPTASVISCARGGIVDEAALLEALRSGQVAGAGLDVFEKEPPDPASPLFSMDNVVTTPHVAGGTVEAMEAMSLLVAEEVLAVLRGEKPRHLVNPAVYERR